MSLARVRSLGLRGIEAYPVLVELDLAGGLPSFSIVGLPDNAVREARERVSAALRNAGFTVPGRRVTVNLSPARPRKQGSHYDLPIALAVLAASGQLEDRGGKRWCAAAELSLDGKLRPAVGALAMAVAAKKDGVEALIVAPENAWEVEAAGLEAWEAEDLCAACAFIAGERTARAPKEDAARPGFGGAAANHPDLSDVRGQALPRRALEVAAAGGHNLLFVGPPGTGKSMLARRLPGVLPPLEGAEALEVALVQSACGEPPSGERPFRAPHHGASAAALVGGGPNARPGEACLAHGGVLFLDELAEFARPALEALRQPLEDRRVRVARARETLEYPARFALIAAANPCPCGWRGHPARPCSCAPAEVARYLSRLSGPLLDRIDLQVETAPVPFEDWARPAAAGEPSAAVAARVAAARRRQAARWGEGAGRLNAFVPSSELRERAGEDAGALRALAAAEKRLALSARALERVLRVARTIADLAGSPPVEARHVAEAAQLRGLDRLKAGLEVHA